MQLDRCYASSFRVSKHRLPENAEVVGRTTTAMRSSMLPADIVMADAAYDSDPLSALMADKGALAVIPNNPSRALKHPLNEAIHTKRHLNECCLSKLKQFKRVVIRYEKTVRNYRRVVALAATMIWLISVRRD